MCAGELKFVVYTQDGETPLHVAARFGQLNMVPALLEEGADPTQVSKVTPRL